MTRVVGCASLVDKQNGRHVNCLARRLKGVHCLSRDESTSTRGGGREAQARGGIVVTESSPEKLNEGTRAKNPRTAVVLLDTFNQLIGTTHVQLY